MPLTIKAVTHGGAGIPEPTRRAAQDSAKVILDVYRKEIRAAVASHLQSRGVEAQACSGPELSDAPRLVAVVSRITTDTGGLGFRAQLDIDASLHIGSARQPPVWSAGFLTGNKTAVGVAPDRENVDAFAANLVNEITRSGWIARPR